MSRQEAVAPDGEPQDRNLAMIWRWDQRMEWHSSTSRTVVSAGRCRRWTGVGSFAGLEVVMWVERSAAVEAGQRRMVHIGVVKDLKGVEEVEAEFQTAQAAYLGAVRESLD